MSRVGPKHRKTIGPKILSTWRERQREKLAIKIRQQAGVEDRAPGRLDRGTVLREGDLR